MFRLTSVFSFVFASGLACQCFAYEPPRMADGKPSLQGTWSNASITRLQRNSNHSKLIIDDNELQKLTDAHPQVVRQKTDDHLDPDDGLLDGKDLARGRGYNAFWIDPGKEYGLVKGTRRSSWITDPANGRIPFKQRDRRAASPAEESSEGDERAIAAGPEARSLGERCIIGFGGTGGPPMLNTLYNNTYQIVQTSDYIMILVEMVHDARIIPIKDKKPLDSSIPRWLGNSIAWWDGDTLVVETTNWHPEQAKRGPVNISQNGKVTERFSRYSDEQIFYAFTVEDPEYYLQPWKGELSFNAIDEHVYEYSCHEGNLGLEGILQGARAKEREAESLNQ